MDLYIVIWFTLLWAYILLYGYIFNGPIYCYMVILLIDLYIVIWLYCYGPIYCYIGPYC